MADREIGAHRDAHLEIEELVRKAGPVFESFVQERIQLDGPMYRQIGPDLRHTLTGTPIEDDYSPAQLRKRYPHGFADWAPDTEEQVAFEILEDAILRPSPKHLARLHAHLGGNDRRYRELLKQTGVDAAQMIRGTMPGHAKPKAKDGDGTSAGSSPSNPWNPKSKFTPQEALAEQTRLLKTLGTKACASMAAACGVSVFGVPLKK